MMKWLNSWYISGTNLFFTLPTSPVTHSFVGKRKVQCNGLNKKDQYQEWFTRVVGIDSSILKTIQTTAVVVMLAVLRVYMHTFYYCCNWRCCCKIGWSLLLYDQPFRFGRYGRLNPAHVSHVKLEIFLHTTSIFDFSKINMSCYDFLGLGLLFESISAVNQIRKGRGFDGHPPFMTLFGLGVRVSNAISGFMGAAILDSQFGPLLVENAFMRCKTQSGYLG